MIKPIVHENAPLTLIGGADVSPTVLNICLNHAPGIIAADGGADVALATGRRPLAVIGDLDSISPDTLTTFKAVTHLITEEDTTDFEKVLARCRAPLILAAGFLGGRLDHSFSVLNTLVRFATAPVILVGEDDIVTLLPESADIALPLGTRVALLPMDRALVTTTGLRWNLDAQVLHPAGLVSSSNAAAAPQVTIKAQGPVLLTLPVSALDALIDVVRAQ